MQNYQNNVCKICCTSHTAGLKMWWVYLIFKYELPNFIQYLNTGQDTYTLSHVFLTFYLFKVSFNLIFTYTPTLLSIYI